MAKNPEATDKNRIRFSFDEMLNELNCMSNVAGNFLRRNPIPQLADELRHIRDSNKTGAQYWRIKQCEPLVTEVCHDGYEPGARKCKFKNVFGELTFVWQVRVELLGKSKKRKTPKHFHLDGLCSTKICLFEQADPAPIHLAQWQFEVGDSSSPGCHFHCGILQAEDKPPFPKGLSIPRLPSVLVTPMDGLDFLLSELLQNDWAMHASDGRHDSIQWSKIQRTRLIKLMEWKIKRLRSSTTSAWTNLKRAKPVEGDLFD